MRPTKQIVPLLLAIIVLQVLFRFGIPALGWKAAPQLWTLENQINIAEQISINAILAFGMTLTIIIGGIDLSVGAIVALAGTTTVYALGVHESQDAVRVALAVSLGLGVAGLFGAVNGLFASRTKMPPFIITLGTMLIAQGIARRFNAGQPIGVPDSETFFLGMGSYRVFGMVPVPVLVMLLLFGLTALPLARFRFGRYAYAIGGNQEAARMSGIPVPRIQVITYLACSLLAGGAGMIHASALRAAEPASGEGFELSAIAAAVVGGTSFTGGRGTLIGTLIGAVIIGTLSKGLNFAGAHYSLQYIIKGAVILAAVYVDVSRRP
jgi:ribose transport system permease protein